MTSKDIHSNQHRAGKRRFEASLKPEEAAIIDKAKEKTQQPSNKGLLLELCRRII